MVPAPISQAITQVVREFQLSQLRSALIPGGTKLFSHELMQKLAQHTVSSQSSVLIAQPGRPICFFPIAPEMAASGCTSGTTQRRGSKSKAKARRSDTGTPAPRHKK